MRHLTRETLVAWRDHPTEDARAPVVGHLATCNACGALYAELIRTRPAEDVADLPDHEDFVARGRALRPTAAPRRRRWPLVTLAAAAVVVLAVFVTWPRPADPPVARGASDLDVIAPVGAVPEATVISWRAPAGSDIFRVEIMDASGNVIHEARVTGSRRFVLPPDLTTRLLPGIQYRWMVSRLDARGDTIDSSPLAAFTITK